MLFKIMLAVWFIAWSPLLLLGLPSRKLTRIFVLADATGVLWLARIIVGIKYKIHYPPREENGVPFKRNENDRLDGKAIIAAKHMSILEIAVLATHITNSFFIIKRELMWIPIYGWAFWRIGFQGVNRTKGSTNIQKLTDAVGKKIMDKQILIIFPEGTRTKPGQKIKLKRGLLFIAESLKLPILPVGTDAGLYWPKKGRMHGGTANVYFEPVLPCNASLEDIREAINRHSA
ncbi:MAG: 1-acyl-sn-glycerol-3-phosphate acyltransferase [Alphaproteobacteria bacterium]|nr:1-acyl-sn-glycerol-3-phosphate acyltransferase [Alphaproteobacteria bacterium]